MHNILAAVLITGALTGPALAQEGDAAKGETVFNKCKTCHMVGENAQNRVGPVLNGVVGRTAGSVPGYTYSAINKSAGEAGLTWTPETLVAYLPDPQAFLENYLKSQGKEVPAGRTKMAYKLPNEQERRDVAAYLASLGK